MIYPWDGWCILAGRGSLPTAAVGSGEASVVVTVVVTPHAAADVMVVVKVGIVDRSEYEKR